MIGIGDQKEIVQVLDRVTAGKRVTQFAPKCNMPLTGQRILATLPFFAYLKIAEGCSNGCAYCAIPAIRGKYRSVPTEKLLEEANALAEAGVTELVVIAQDTTRYGEDLYGENRLPQLLRALCQIEKLHWIRVLYCYPERITDELIDTVAQEPKIVKYLDIPIQHADDAVLRAMRRDTDAASLRALMKKLRARIPGVVIRTTLLVGFPGETEEAFDALCDFVQEMRFDRLGCFAYSEEEHTLAAKMENQIDEETRIHRAEIVMQQQGAIAEALNEARVGTVTEAVTEEYDKESGMWIARTAADAPDVDGRLWLAGGEKDFRVGQYVRVRILDTAEIYDLTGEVIED